MAGSLSVFRPICIAFLIACSALQASARTNYTVAYEGSKFTAVDPLMEYLEEEVGRLFDPPLHFSARPTTGTERRNLAALISEGNADFVFAEEVSTVCSQAMHDLFPLAEETLSSELDGGLIVAKKDQDEITSLENISGSTVVRFYAEENSEQLLGDVISGDADIGFVPPRLLLLHPEHASKLQILQHITVNDDHSAENPPVLPHFGRRTFSAGASVAPEVAWAVTQALVGLSPQHPAAMAAQAPGFTIPRSIAHTRSVLEEQGVLRYEGAERGWRCLGDIDALHTFVTCPEELLKVPSGAMMSACNASGRACPAAAAACLCSPCRAIAETEVRSWTVGAGGQQCSHLGICAEPPQLDTVAFELVDNLHRNGAEVEVESLLSNADGTMLKDTHRVARNGSHTYRFNLSFQYVGLVTIDVRLAGQPIEQSPFFLLVQHRTCSEGREASESGECRCTSGRMEVLRHCVGRGAFLSGMLLPPVVVLILVVVVFVRQKIKAADAFWVIDLHSLSFDSPPECIGQGPSGEVMKAHLLGSEVAVKTHWYEVKATGLDMSESGLPRATSGHSFSRMSTPCQIHVAMPPFVSSNSWRQMEHAFATSPHMNRAQSVTVDSFFGLAPTDSGTGNPAGKTELHTRLNKLLERHNRDRTSAEADHSTHSNPANQRGGSLFIPESERAAAPRARRLSAPSLTGSDAAASPTPREARRRSSLKPPSSRPSTSEAASPTSASPTSGVARDRDVKIRFHEKATSSTEYNGPSAPVSAGTAVTGADLIDLQANPERRDSSNSVPLWGAMHRVPSLTSPSTASTLPRLPCVTPPNSRARPLAQSDFGPLEESIQRAESDAGPPGVRAEIVLQVDECSDAAPAVQGEPAVNGPAGETKTDLEVGGVDGEEVQEDTSDSTEGDQRRRCMEPTPTSIPGRSQSLRGARLLSTLTRTSSLRGSGEQLLPVRGRMSPWAREEESDETPFVRWVMRQWDKVETLLSPKSPASSKFVAEMRILSRVRHPCITTVMGAVLHRDHALLVIEFMRYGSLQDLYLNEMMELDGDLLHPILTDIASGMHFIHSHSPPIIHGDLKAGNVLVDERFRAKVSDFGFSGGEMDGTLFWMAPEVLLGGPATKQSDAYSFGVVLCELLSRKPPYEGESATAVMMGVINKDISKRPDVPPDAPTPLKRMMSKCWSHEPDQRPNFAEIRGLLGGLSPSDFSTRVSRKYVVPAAEGAEGVAAQGASAGVGNGIVYDMFPKHVADALMKGERAPEDRRDCATVLFCDIVGFTTLSSQLDTTQVSDMLDRLFIQFDDLATQHGIHKLETIGDCYIGVSNLVEPQPDDHVARMARFSLGILEAAKRTLIDLNDPTRGHVVVRVGFDAGPVVGNVVGTRHLKYTVFGNTVNTASRMESTSVPMKAQCTKRAAELLLKQDPTLRIQERGQVEIKGKGSMTTFFVVPHAEWTSMLQLPPAESFGRRESMSKAAAGAAALSGGSPLAGNRTASTNNAAGSSSSPVATRPSARSTGNERCSTEEAIYVSPRPLNPRLGSASLSALSTEDPELEIRQPRRSSLLRKMKSSPHLGVQRDKQGQGLC